MATIPSSVARTDGGGQGFLQEFQGDVDRRQDFSSPFHVLGNVLDGHHAHVDPDAENLPELP
jgi:hypothetical protein